MQIELEWEDAKMTAIPVSSNEDGGLTTCGRVETFVLGLKQRGTTSVIARFRHERQE